MKYYRRKSVPSPIIDGEVAYIELTRGMVSIIDAEYADEIGKYMWRASKGSGWCYAVRWRGSELVRMHRELIGARDGEMVDHINGNGLDNRLSNLRIADASLNGANSKKQRNNSIGYKGVRVLYPSGRYGGNVMVRGKNIAIGSYDTPEEAAFAYDKIAYAQFGEFALLNSPSSPWPRAQTPEAKT